jgi:hypothetical protein
MAEGVTGYYRSERTTAFTFIGLGVVSAGVGTGLVATRGDFATGLGVAMISVGALEVLGSAFYAAQVAAELDHYAELRAREALRPERGLLDRRRRAPVVALGREALTARRARRARRATPS